MRIKKLTGIALVFCIILFSYGCNFLKSDEAIIEERINTLADAYNAGDVDALINCFDSKTRTTVNSALGIGNAVLGKLTGLGISVQDVLGLGAGLAGMEYGDSIEIYSVDNINISGNNATADVSLSFTDIYSKSKNTDSGEISVGLVKENGDWFVKNLKE